ncbi:fibrillin-1-like [Diadema antillarum]|uniref:fibrillin-1-like n=1 Tax=Diadema antillarum TaxID=105358 RepID=UPI003A8682A4
MLRSSVFVLLACVVVTVLAQNGVINGPNVCGMRFYSYCCPGWRLDPKNKMCVTPICRNCGTGNCHRPNSCSCADGSISVSGCDGISAGGGNRCQTQCLNGGHCRGGTCSCPSGFAGESCQFPVCNPPCQNGGQCSGGNRCSCPHGFGGSQCQTDYRTGPCYLQAQNGFCSAVIEGIQCTKALCCSTIGQGWGDTCETCDTFTNPCDLGYILDGRTGQCKDADECRMIPGLCEGGRCANTPGSFACQCPSGYELDMTTLVCADINECESSLLCQNGRCINAQGSFTCECYPGYTLSPDNTQCIDINIPFTVEPPEELGFCYLRYRSRQGTCSRNLAAKLSFEECCCQVESAQAWGSSSRDCSICPERNSALYVSICSGRLGTTEAPASMRSPLRLSERPTSPPGFTDLPGPSITTERKEVTPPPEGICAWAPRICLNGRCISLGGLNYRCECYRGYESAGQHTCQDINECRDNTICNYGTCENLDGTFRCICPNGYQISANQRYCEDVDECRTNPNVCQHGTCMNLIGSHTCECYTGYKLSIDGRYCIDVDECTLGTHSCSNAQCINLPGTYECSCQEGYEPMGTRGCIDINECALRNPCQVGYCVNTLGSYFCQCPVGYARSDDGTCIESRRGFCYLDGDMGRCTHQSGIQVTISTCCCSAVLLKEATSWGPNCESCPPQGTLQFEELCRHGIGRDSLSININECTLFNNLCVNGICEDLTGNFRCKCNPGFQVTSDGKSCTDINECAFNRLLCRGGTCRNTPGAYICDCPEGLELDSRGSYCQDKNECDDPNLCENGRCINTRGSFRCECINPGTALDETGTVCIDNRVATCWTRIVNGQCEADIMGPMRRDQCCSTFGRAWGSPCEACPLSFGDCPRGYTEVDDNCIDVNECEINPMVCNNGECQNTLGSYRCVCPPGLTLDTSGRNCIDLRSYECYLDYSEGECMSPIPGLYRNSVCCCSMGYAYGDQGKCYECPIEDSVQFDMMCPRGRGYADTRPRPELLDGSVYVSDINECLIYEGICKNGECTNTQGSFECLCDMGFAMDEFSYQCIDIDECSITFGACGNGTCENVPGDFRCNCFEGYEAHAVMRTCMDIDECTTVQGLCRGGSCTNLPGSFRCDCPRGQELTADGRACRDINECSISHGICSNGECQNVVGTYRCMCNPGFRPTSNYRACQDMDECEMANGGCDHTCVNTQGSFECQCHTGFRLMANGRSCADVNECTENPDICGGGQCDNQEGTYVCDCFPGFRPADNFRSCLDIDECSADSSICVAGTCKNTRGSYTCQCFEGYSMKPNIDGCSDIDECMLQIHKCAINSQCENTQGSFVCICNPGFIVDGNICVDIDECESANHECHENARCVNIPGSYQCQCNQGFIGDGLSCIDVDECMQNQALCLNGQCLNMPGRYECECEMGFYPSELRDSCEDIDECSNFPDICVFGQCINVPGTFRCECNPGYMLDSGGGNCTDVNECEDPDTYCVSGTCINTKGSYICQCPPNWVLSRDGTACTDIRRGVCYASVPDDPRLDIQTCSLPIGDNIPRSNCCCSVVGKGWGTPCEICPEVNTTAFNRLCPFGLDAVVDPSRNGTGRPSQEIKECSQFENLCKGGQCVEISGGYKCVCPTGYQYNPDAMECIDVNECQLNAYICGAGTCMNMRGSYTCICPQGFMFMNMPTGKNCMDIRELTCYLSYNQSAFPLPECGNPLLPSLTKKICCCSALMASAWGTQQDCSPCPAPMSEDYYRLCGGTHVGHVVDPITGLPHDINECDIPGICEPGLCVNTEGSFRCDCPPGYRSNAFQHTCEDIDECMEGMSRCLGPAFCVNTPGNHECQCPRGFQLSVSRVSCDDINECLTRPDVCANGQCTNQIGSYLCICDNGFQLSEDGTECFDIDECFRFPDRCGNGTCQNAMGSFSCSCHPGFERNINGECTDINECATMLGTCHNGRCVNTPGSFFCDCIPGYVLSASGLRCEDENECITRENLCQFGRCDNVIGSFRCTCYDGFQLSPSGQECIDTNECLIIPDMCMNGRCENTLGSFQCTCPPEYMLSSDGLICIDMRRMFCFNDFIGGLCTDPRVGNATRKECCCSLGAGWGDPCNLCPQPSDPDFLDICPDGPGYAPRLTPEIYEDINECKVFPGICENGNCINTDGSYRCQCPDGYLLDTSGRICIDRNECQEEYNVCGYNSTCFNTLGSFECQCGEGYQVGRRGRCEDINECRRRRGQCAFRCQNLPGSFRCLCPTGYTLTEDGRHCRDLDECSLPTNGCRYRCKNLIGKFMCLCAEGYTSIGGDGNNCRDINECAINVGLCLNGRCINQEGTYTCACNEGYMLGPSGQECMDRRTGFCYAFVPPGGCQAGQSGMQPVTMETCCCSGGRAWGPACDICPVFGTIEYNRLCTTSVTPADPCQVVAGLCENGNCLGSSGGYMCQCNPGFILSPDGTRCEDENECNQVPPPCSYQCKNTPGSFRCGCPQGYILAEDGLTCREKDECSLGIHDCQFECRNTLGGFRCVCPDGYMQHGSTCLDINECLVNTDACGPYGTCQNTQGSYRCECQRFFRVDPSGQRCVDINECEEQPSICQYGCQNIVGGYRCVCPDGFGQNFYGMCIDNNECMQPDVCGQARCYNTQGSYQCGCSSGFAFDQQNLMCNDINECQSSYGGQRYSPCQYSCQNTEGSFSCGCPPGYTSVVQGACVTDRDSTQPCYHCSRTTGGRQRRSVEKASQGGDAEEGTSTEPSSQANNTAILYHIPLSKAVPKQRVARFKTGYVQEVATYNYVILSGNDDNTFAMRKRDDGIALLRFNKRVSRTGLYKLEIEGILQTKNKTVLAEVQTVVVEPVTMQIQVQIVPDNE